MIITEGLGDQQLLITEGYGTTIEEVGYPIGERIVQIEGVGVPRIVGNRPSGRGRISSMEEAA